MVIVTVPLVPAVLVAATAEKLPEPLRTVVLMALLGIALVGLLLVVATLLGGHWVRRIGSHRRGPSIPPDRESLLRSSVEHVRSAGSPTGGDPSDPLDDTIDEHRHEPGETRVD
ncbi:MAG: hypothetical protein KF847_02515 [Pirellulales bacterium]|nr:hypothetical protein [Pirellulales bacterium]